mmetsp:Transcript_14050/g.35809  ORF Transcript_14050/g.35809 Transcript_14050/m.35809 type:complete len:220 (-) Transcript_14050:157-816(-)
MARLVPHDPSPRMMQLPHLLLPFPRVVRRPPPHMHRRHPHRPMPRHALPQIRFRLVRPRRVEQDDRGPVLFGGEPVVVELDHEGEDGGDEGALRVADEDVEARQGFEIRAQEAERLVEADVGLDAVGGCPRVKPLGKLAEIGEHLVHHAGYPVEGVSRALEELAIEFLGNRLETAGRELARVALRREKHAVQEQHPRLLGRSFRFRRTLRRHFTRARSS